jgi:hypothetical protein
MFFVIDKSRLQRVIRIVREDRTLRTQGQDSPFMRLAADGDQLIVSGHRIEGAFPATVYESGVVFIRTTLFRRLLDTFIDEKFLSLQVDKEGLHIGNVFLSFDAADMVLFSNVEQAPTRWPAELPEGERDVRPPQGELFGD